VPDILPPHLASPPQGGEELLRYPSRKDYQCLEVF